MEKQKIRRVTREIRVKLSPKQLNEKRDEAAEENFKKKEAEKELANLTGVYKEAKTEIDEQIKRADMFIDRTLREIREKKADITSECDEVRNYEEGTVEYYHPNFESGDMVDFRPMNADEHQATLLQEKAESIPTTGMEISECVN